MLFHFICTGEITTIYIIRLTMNLTVFQMCIAKSSQYVLAETSLRYVASIKSTVCTRMLLLAVLVSFLSDIWKTVLNFKSIAATKLFLKICHILLVVKSIFPYYLRLSVKLLSWHHLLLLLLILIERCLLMWLVLLLLLLVVLSCMWFKTRTRRVTWK